MDEALLEQEPVVESKLVAAWLDKIDTSRKEESNWRKSCKEIWNIYAPSEDAAAPAYNILYSNTEILLPTVYSNPPKADVRRRYGDKDLMAKIVSQGIERVLDFQLDEYDFDYISELSVMDGLITGRGVVRVRYVPEFSDAEFSDVGGIEKLERESCRAEYIKWEDYARSSGKIWNDVTWVGYRSYVRKELALKEFGKVANELVYDYIANKEDNGQQAEAAKQDKRAVIWEIWDKNTKKVRYLAPCYKEKFLKVEDDPLGLKDFFPQPRPLQFIPNTTSLVPTPDYKQYEKQALELSEISRRIIRITQILKIRGIYDSTIDELQQLFDSADNTLIPAQNITSIIERGGIDKAIWLMPIQEAANVLKYLVELRETTKQVIYEISGISDIMRGSSKASETLGAQQIKAQFADTRLKRRQKEVARFLRDVLRLKAEIIAEHFQPESILKIANMNIEELLPAAQEGEDPRARQQMLAQKEQELMTVLRDETVRNYKIDVETDSTIAYNDKDSQEQTAAFLQAINQFFAMATPLVQAGALPMEAVKAILGTVARKYKMGEEFEGALDMLQSPPKDDGPEKIEEAKLALENKKIDNSHKEAIDKLALEAADIGASYYTPRTPEIQPEDMD